MDWALIGAIAIFPAIICYVALSYLVSNKILKPPLFKPAQVIVNTVSIGFRLLILGAIGYALFDWYVTESGWMPRTREIEVYVHASNWVAGELKICHSFSTGRKDELKSLFCANDRNESHTLMVKFWGPITTDRDRIWKCEREQSSLTCKLQ